jgi:polar amino acid transport system substrate-binding protein
MTRPIAVLCIAISLLFAADQAGASEKIRIATEGYYAPFNYFDESGKLAGFDVDIGEALCEKMKTECEFVQQDWDALIPGLQEGKYDVIVASMSITEEREKKVSFTIPYYSNMLTFIGKKDSGIEISDEGLESKSVGTLRSTVSADYLEEHYSGIVNIRLYDTQDAALEDLAEGKLDLVLGDNLPSYSWLETDAGESHEFIGEFIDINDRISIAVRKDDDALREKLDQALIAILEDGTYQEINEKYFPFSIYF